VTGSDRKAGGAVTQLVFRTSQCSRHGHQEFTILFSERPPVHGLEKTLLSHFENAVARGATFRPGQFVQLGWASLRLMSRPDGTLGVQEFDSQAEGGWVESVDKALMAAWSQKEVVLSVGLQEPAFPGQMQDAVVCKKLLEGHDEYQLSRSDPDDDDDSGWFLACFGKDHDHDKASELAMTQLVHVTTRLPFITQFLALPAGADVHLTGPGRIRATVFIDGEERVPLPGSYLAGMSA